MLSESVVKDALKVVIDPDLHRDIVTLGFVKDVVIDESEVSITISRALSLIWHVTVGMVVLPENKYFSRESSWTMVC